MNNSQRNAQVSLVAGMKARGFDNVEYAVIDNSNAQDVAVGNWKINPNSICIQWLPETVADRVFPIIELRPSGIPALPEISTYNESGNRAGDYLPVSEYASVTADSVKRLVTSHDAALFGDFHFLKTRKAITARVPAPVPAPVPNVTDQSKALGSL